MTSFTKELGRKLNARILYLCKSHRNGINFRDTKKEREKGE